ncbi:MAG: DUF2612 domain-containing protein [Methanobrevibacter sp.]|nr:DUF2612 domain-containing protein [Methanobrevibacter sp.]
MSEYTDYYADLLILQYKTQPKARATISALTEKVIADGLLLDVINGFNLLTAEGKQLDLLGKYIGLSRNVKEEVSSPSTVILTDEQYRLLLQLKIVCNTSYSSTSQIRKALFQLFPDDIRVFDDRTMEMEYQLSERFDGLEQVIISEELLPFPMGLGFNVIIVPDLLKLYGYYGYDGLNNNPNGYSSYTDGFRGKFLSYGDRT